MLSLGSLDSKCIDGCWYCEGNCHHCLQPANMGYSLRTIGGNKKVKVLKFCKNNPCYSFYSEDPAAIPTIIIPLPFSSPASELLLQVTKVISTDWSKHTVMTVQLCVARNSQNDNGFNVGQLYVLTQFRTVNFQAFFDFSISEEYVPLSALHYMKHKNSIIMYYSALFMMMLKLIIQDALHKTSYKTLEILLKSATEGEKGLHKDIAHKHQIEDEEAIPKRNQFKVTPEDQFQTENSHEEATLKQDQFISEDKLLIETSHVSETKDTTEGMR